LISLTKKEDVEHAKSLASSDVFKHGEILPKLFGELKDRYASRAGGFTRVLHLEPRLGDNAEQSIVELVDGTREMKFWMTARIVARLQKQGLEVDQLTQHNIDKLTRHRKQGQEEFESLVKRLKEEFYKTEESLASLPSNNLKSPVEPVIKENIKIVPRPARE
jgi:Glu-tRNA(Gln) amidotransferase subunit E-like FAD-binding protein